MFARTKLSVALWGAFGALLLMSIVQGALVTSNVTSVVRSGGRAQSGVEALTRNLGEVEESAQAASLEVETLAERVSKEIADSLRDGEADIKLLERSVARAVQSTSQVVEQLSDLLDSSDLDDDTADVIEGLLFESEDSADQIRKEAMPLVRAAVERMGATAEKGRGAASEIESLVPIVQGFATISRSATREANDVSDQIQRGAEQAIGARSVTLFAAGATLVLGVVIPLVLVPRINSEVTKIVEVLERVAGGDLRPRVGSAAFEEFCRIAAAVNATISTISEAVSSIRSGSDGLVRSSRALAETSEALSAGASRTTMLSNGVAGASEEMSIAMGEVARSVEQVSKTNDHVAVATEQLKGRIVEVSNSAKRALDVASEASELVDAACGSVSQLSDTATEIADVIQIIQDIADMTNLLALNASIEAARAGEAGKGFAVVATEVKDLAAQTSTATEQIRDRIAAMQSASGAAVGAVDKINEVIARVRGESDQITDAVVKQSKTTDGIVEEVNQAASAASTVAVNVTQSAQASQEITQSIADVDGAAKSTACAATDTLGHGEKLKALSIEMNEVLARFQTA